MANDKPNKPYLTSLATKEAAKLGLTGEGHNDALDAFRHAYISALFSYYSTTGIASVFGWANEIKGDFLNNQPPAERRMDEFNNEVGRGLGSVASSTEEIAPLIYKALMNGQLIIKETDTTPSSPLAAPSSDMSDPEAENPLLAESIENITPLSSTSITSTPLPSSSAGAGIGGIFNSMASKIGGFFGVGGSSSSSSSDFGNLTQIGLNPTTLENIFKGGIDKLMDQVAERISKNDNFLSMAFGKTLSQNSGMFANLLSKGGSSGSFEDMFMGKNGSGGLFNDFIGNALDFGLNKLFNSKKTKTFSSETAESIAAGKAWQPSQSQQAAYLAQLAQQGSKNL